MLYAFMRLLARFMVRTYLFGGLFKVGGTDFVPRHGSLLVCSNHQSTLEPPAVAAFLPRADSWNMAKSEFFQGGALKRWLFVSYHSFPVIRNSPDRAALRRSVDILKAGQTLIIYPEGTRVPEGGLIKPAPGAGWLATVTGGCAEWRPRRFSERRQLPAASEG
jgi:1-acyl-sn-glycerol-3-phosphate acyltransferase